MFSVDFLNEIRSLETAKIAEWLPAGGSVLEIGAGTGQQAIELEKLGFDVTAIELASSDYASDRLFPIIDYNGLTLPFPDGSFDAVFSSNVLEHVPDLANMSREIRRVLKPGGVAVHAMPTHAWRFWTTLTTVPTGIQRAIGAGSALAAARALASSILQKRHGERGNVITEMRYFRPSWWLRSFEQNGFVVTDHQPSGMFYTGNMLAGPMLPVSTREALAQWLGSACHIFKVRSK